jgi:hypothetical protein
VATKFARLFSKRGVVLVLSVAVAVALAKAGHSPVGNGYGFFDGPR